MVFLKGGLLGDSEILLKYAINCQITIDIIIVLFEIEVGVLIQ